jgi:hypothetical protein
MDFATKQVVHANGEIRQAAISLISEARRIAGDQQIEPFLISNN